MLYIYFFLYAVVAGMQERHRPAAAWCWGPARRRATPR